MSDHEFTPSGVIPACLLPFDTDLAIDGPAYRNHLRDLASVAGISAITVNGHAAEIHALTFDEQKEGIRIAVDELDGQLPIVAGVYTGSSLEAGHIGKMAEDLGADGLLVFPATSTAFGGQLRPEIAIRHIESIVEQTRLPIILFQYPLGGGFGYPLDTLLDLCQRFPTIRAIKDWCNDGALHERHIRELHALDRPVNVLTTHSAWLLGSCVMGCDGLLSGAGSVIADLQVALWEAVTSKNLALAQAVDDRIYHTVRAFYREPLLDMHNRMKEALVLLGRLSHAGVRPPLMKLSDSEIRFIAECLEKAGLTPETVYRGLELEYTAAV